MLLLLAFFSTISLQSAADVYQEVEKTSSQNNTFSKYRCTSAAVCLLFYFWLVWVTFGEQLSCTPLRRKQYFFKILMYLCCRLFTFLFFVLWVTFGEQLSCIPLRRFAYFCFYLLFVFVLVLAKNFRASFCGGWRVDNINWEHLGVSGSIWEHLEASGSIWEHLGVIWEHLGVIWESSGGEHRKSLMFIVKTMIFTKTSEKPYAF